MVQWTTHVAYAVGHGMTHPDTLWYHGPFAAQFVQEGAFTGIESLGYDAARFFPFNSQLVHSLTILAYDRDIASPFVNLGWLALALLAAWCIGARRGLGHVSVAAAAVGLGLPIMTATQPGQASSDIACAALFLAALVLLLESELRPVPLALAGLATGMALSTKITVAVPVVVLVTAVAVLCAWRRQWVAAVVWSAAFVLTGTFWFFRDWVVSGNPLPWFELRLGPLHFARQIPPSSPSLAHDVLDPYAWDALYLDGVWQGLGRAWPAIVALLLGPALALVIRQRRRWDAVELVLGLVVLAGAVGYVVTPMTGGFSFVFNLRYLSPILLLALAAIPLVMPARMAPIALGVLAILVVVGATMPNREQVPAWPSDAVLPSVLLVGAAIGLVAVAVRTRAFVRVGALAVVLAFLAFGFAQRQYLDHRYVDAGLGTEEIDEYFRDVRHADVVVFGSDASLPFFGTDLSNHVRRGDLPPVDTGDSPCRTWRRVLADKADYVVMLRGQFGYFVSPPDVAVAGDRAARPVLATTQGTVFEIDGSFDPSTCPPGT